MKQGTNFPLEVKIGVPLCEVETVSFIFAQDDASVRFEWPSEDTFCSEDNNSITLRWNEDQTYLFDTDKLISMDTKIILKNSEFNPKTPIKTYRMEPTLFEWK